MSKKAKKFAIKSDEERQAKINTTDLYLSCRDHAAMVLAKLNDFLDVGTIMEKLDTSIERIFNGKTTEIEAMLITQAKVLEFVCYDAIGQLARAEMQHAEIYANIAFRAQNQSRKTLLALKEIKDPRRSIFVKQQNNAVNQQINNAMENAQLNDFENSEKVANELLREQSRQVLNLVNATKLVEVNQEVANEEN